jgi:hypothetical protein
MRARATFRAAWAVCGVLAAAIAVGPTGCRGRADGVPEAAKFQKASKRRIAWTAPGDGTAYVVDDWYNRLIYSGPVRQGDEIVVDPEANELSVGGKAVPTEKKLTSADHSLWLLTGGGE